MAGPSVRKHVQRNGHFIESRGKEFCIGLVLAVVGLILLWDVFDGRGKKLPWPASGMVPW